MRKFKVKVKESVSDRIIGGLGRIFKKRPEVIDLSGGKFFEQKCIIIGNHNGAGGPFHYRTFLDKRFMSWGAHPMCEGFLSRRRYLYNVFYRQKLGYSKFKAGFMSVAFGLVSGIVYRFAGVLPVYYDNRIFYTYKYSLECFEKNVSILIFPENSEGGYKEVPEELFTGFLNLYKVYSKRYSEPLPIYTLYYSKKPKSIIIGKPIYIDSMLKDRSDEEILEIFKSYMGELRAFVPDEKAA